MLTGGGVAAGKLGTKDKCYWTPARAVVEERDCGFSKRTRGTA